ncbi:hypothetical protein JW865_00290 [Candidatus Bathyarchaeota archaeon]|nr:hypothetical protein [Candidatus Bathyarchaeota archaeon]
MVHILDEVEWRESLDKEGYYRKLSIYPDECSEGLSLGESLQIKYLKELAFNSVIILGSDESAVTGLIIRDWLLNESHLPIFICRSSELPLFVDDTCLVIAISYTGETLETLNAFKEAVNRQCKAIVISSGGELTKLSKNYGYPNLKLPEGNNSKTSLPYQLFALAIIFKKLGLVKENLWEIDEAIKIIEDIRCEATKEIKNNFIKKLAVELEGYVPIIYGPPLHKNVLNRISDAFNINSKILSSSGFFPEVFHNGIMLMESSNDNLKRIGLIIIRDYLQEKFYADKLDAIKILAKERLGKVVEIDSLGRGRLSRLLSILYIGDFLSYYLAMLYGKDPSIIETVRTIEVLNL